MSTVLLEFLSLLRVAPSTRASVVRYSSVSRSGCSPLQRLAQAWISGSSGFRTYMRCLDAHPDKMLINFDPASTCLTSTLTAAARHIFDTCESCNASIRMVALEVSGACS